MRSEFPITKKLIDYSTRKSAKWEVLAVRANWIYSKGLNGRPRKILVKNISEFQITKKSIDYSTGKLAKVGVFLLCGTFEL